MLQLNFMEEVDAPIMSFYVQANLVLTHADAFYSPYILYSATLYIPQGVTVMVVNATAMRISWNSSSDTGRIAAFEVMYASPMMSARLINVTGNVTSLILTGLGVCVVNKVLVRAYTSQGPGPFSAPAQDTSANGEMTISI